MMKKKTTVWAMKIFLTAFFVLAGAFSAGAQTKSVKLSIASGPTGANYYAQSGAMAALLSKCIPNLDVTAEATNASVDNCKLLHHRKAEMGLSIADISYDALKGQGRFKDIGPMGLRSICVLYPFYLHFVTLQGSGINSVYDFRGKRLAVGAPGSGTEVTTMRVLESYGINMEKDLKKQNLHGIQAVDALKDRKIDGVTWVVGVPTAGLLDLSASPGFKMKILDNIEHFDKLKEKYGPVYTKGVIPKTTYSGMEADAQVVSILTLLMCHEGMDADLVYKIIKALLENRSELVAFHKDFDYFTLNNAVLGSSLPFHPGAIRYYQEKGVKID